MDELLKNMKLDDSLAQNMELDSQENESSNAQKDERHAAESDENSEDSKANHQKDSIPETVAESFNADPSADSELKQQKSETGPTDSASEKPESQDSKLESEKPESDSSSIEAARAQAERQPLRPVSAGLPRIQRKMNENREFSVILRTRGREFSQALMTFAGTKQRSGRLWLTFGAMLIVIALLIIQVAYRHRELNLGYELSDAISQRESLLEENRKLRIELRVLSRRERLEPLAGKQLGMTTIRPEQVLIIDTNNVERAHHHQGKRQDGLDNVRRIGEE